MKKPFSNIKNKNISLNYDKLINDNKHDPIYSRKQNTKRMYWSTEMNEFFRHALVNSNLDYKAIAIKFISLNEALQVIIP